MELIVSEPFFGIDSLNDLPDLIITLNDYLVCPYQYCVRHSQKYKKT